LGRFVQTSYVAASWSKPRKVIARVEASEQVSDVLHTHALSKASLKNCKCFCALIERRSTCRMSIYVPLLGEIASKRSTKLRAR